MQTKARRIRTTPTPRSRTGEGVITTPEISISRRAQRFFTASLGLSGDTLQNPLFIALAITLGVSTPVARAQMANPSYETVSRCFFVYAPITELGRDLPNAQLYQFGQPRLGWASGYLQANQNNTAFKQIFESSVEKNKRMAIQLENSLKQAVATRNQPQFSSVIEQAVACDRALGIRTTSIPAL